MVKSSPREFVEFNDGVGNIVGVHLQHSKWIVVVEGKNGGRFVGAIPIDVCPPVVGDVVDLGLKDEKLTFEAFNGESL